MRYDDPNVPASAIVGIISAILLFAIIVALQALFYSFEEQELQRKVYGRPYEALQQLDADQVERLNSYGWISEPDGVAHIPIDRAMEITVEELAQE